MQLIKHAFWLVSLTIFNRAAQAQTILPDLVGLMSPIIIQDTSTEIILSDYFLNPENIERVVADNSFRAILTSDKKTLTLEFLSTPPILSNLDFYTKNGLVYSVLVKSKKITPTKFTFKDEGYTAVSVIGDMNSWSGKAGEMKKVDGLWQITFSLNEGDYEYQFVADGVNKKDISNPLSSANGKNSLIHIQRIDPKDLPELFTLIHTSDSVTIGIMNPKPDKIFIYVENSLVLPNVHRFGGDYVFNKNTFKFKIPIATRLKKRTNIRIFSCNSAGESNDILIPLENGTVIDSAAALDRNDVPAQITYLALVDRFNDGNKHNNKPSRDKRVNPMSNWQGGDIAGIQNKMTEGYFDSLNINALWISPIGRNPDSAFLRFGQLAMSSVQPVSQQELLIAHSSSLKTQHWSTGYHGGWSISNSEIDPHFGSESEMKAMVSTAHNKNMSVLLDCVAYYTRKENALIISHPEYFTSADSKNGNRNLSAELSSLSFEPSLAISGSQLIAHSPEPITENSENNFLPTFDLSKPEVVELNTDSTVFWLKKYDLDGFRNDATKHIPNLFWRELTKKIKKEMAITEKQFYQIGETYGNRQMIKSCVNSGIFDAQIDFNFYFDAREALAKDTTSLSLIAKGLRESFNYFGYHSTMGNITSNPDQPRLISYAGSALSWTEDATEAGFTRKIGVGNPIGYKRLQMTTALMCAIPGIPVIYYGDEIGIPGAGNPDNHRMMYFKKLTPYEIETKQITQKVTKLRRKRISLSYGDTEILFDDKNTLVLARTYFGEITIIAFNKSKKVQNVQFNVPWRFRNELFKSQFRNTFDMFKNEMTIQLHPVSFDFITN